MNVREKPTMLLKVAAHSILVSCTSLQILLEVLLNVKNLTDVAHAKRFALIDRKCLRSTDCVLDLTSIQVVSRQIRVVLIVKRRQIHPCHCPCTLDEDLKDSFLGFRIQVIIP